MVHTMVRPSCANCFNSNTTCVDVELSKWLKSRRKKAHTFRIGINENECDNLFYTLWTHFSMPTLITDALSSNNATGVTLTSLVRRKTWPADYPLALMQLLSAFVVHPINFQFSFFAPHTNQLLLKSVESVLEKVKRFMSVMPPFRYMVAMCFFFFVCCSFLISKTHSNFLFWMRQVIADFQIGRKMHRFPNGDVRLQYIILHNVGCLTSEQFQISRSAVYCYVSAFQIRAKWREKSVKKRKRMKKKITSIATSFMEKETISFVSVAF